MSDLRSDPRCPERSPLRRLIDLIDAKLLVPSLGNNKTLRKDAIIPPPISGFGPPSRVDTAATTVFKLPPGTRATSEEMLEELQSILANDEAFVIPDAQPPRPGPAFRAELNRYGQSLTPSGPTGPAGPGSLARIFSSLGRRNHR